MNSITASKGSRLVAAWLLLSAALGASAQTYTVSNLWSIPTGQRDYITTNATERGAAISPLTGNVLVASRAGGLQIAILDGTTGEYLGGMLTDEVTGGTFALNVIGVADDGAIYAANLVSPSADTRHLKIYRWQDEYSVPTVAYDGNPSDGQRYGDSLDVRGAGAATQLVLGTANSATGVRFSLFTTTDGLNFTHVNFSPASGVSAGQMQKGIAFGQGTNIYGKINGAPLKLLTFDLASGTTTFVRDIAIPNNVSPISYDLTNRLVAGLDYASHSLLVYDVADPAAPALVSSNSLPTPYTANGNGVGAVDFAGSKLVVLDTQNALACYQVLVDNTPVPPTITVEPADRSVYPGVNVTLSTGATGTKPISYQWFHNDAPIETGTNAVLSFTNIPTGANGTYYAIATNLAGSATSRVATLTVRTPASSAVLTPLWSLSPGSRQYLNTDSTQRGLACNPATTNLLLISRTGSNQVVVLDGLTGDYKHHLRLTDGSGLSIITGGTLALNMLGVADDGVVYAGNLVTDGTAAAFKLYRWQDDSPDAIPTTVTVNGLAVAGRWGDTFDIRGAGNQTQVLLGTRSGNQFAVLTTADSGQTFDARVFTVADAVAGNFGLGITFGAADTIWGTASGQSLRHASFDLSGGAAATITDYPDPGFPSAVTCVAVDAANNLLVGIALETPDNVQAYQIAGEPAVLTLVDQELIMIDNANINGTGSADFGGGRLYVMDSNNGVQAFTVDPNAAPSTPPQLGAPAFAAGTFSCTLSGTAGAQFKLQFSADFTTWNDVGTYTIPAGGSQPVQHTPAGNPAALFYRAVSP